MPSKAAMRPIVASVSAAMAAQQVARRTFATTQHITRARPTARCALNQPSLRQAFRRSYADNINPETKKQIKKKGAGFLRWTWRITYLSAIAGLGWFTYGVYESRTPPEQQEPDPKKKTLVVLGMWKNHKC